MHHRTQCNDPMHHGTHQNVLLHLTIDVVTNWGWTWTCSASTRTTAMPREAMQILLIPACVVIDDDDAFEIGFDDMKQKRLWEEKRAFKRKQALSLTFNRLWWDGWRCYRSRCYTLLPWAANEHLHQRPPCHCQTNRTLREVTTLWRTHIHWWVLISVGSRAVLALRSSMTNSWPHVE